MRAHSVIIEREIRCTANSGVLPAGDKSRSRVQTAEVGQVRRAGRGREVLRVVVSLSE